MSDEILNHIIKLKQMREDFALVTVISRYEPSSGKVGDKAVVDRAGILYGWIGGGCVKSIVCKESIDAIQSGLARRVLIGQKESASTKEIKIYKMTCQSEGTVEVFIEPQVQVPHLIIMGKTMIAKAMAHIAKAMNYNVTIMAPDIDPFFYEKADTIIDAFEINDLPLNPIPYILIATQGESDEQALDAALKTNAQYIGFIASRKKKEAVWKYLLETGHNQDALDKIFSPAGLDINAKKPEEVAVSILAQIIQVRSGLVLSAKDEKEKLISQFYINPVCGVPVDKNNPKHVIEYKNDKVYFCCDGCKIKFEKDPDRYFDPAYKYEPM